MTFLRPYLKIFLILYICNIKILILNKTKTILIKNDN
jgi:hypothetical protein